MQTISDVLSANDCQQILENVFGSHCTKFVNYKITSFHDVTMGFLAGHYRLTIDYNQLGVMGKVSLFLKIMPLNNEKQKKCVESMGVFRKEILVLKNLINPFLDLVESPFAPICYFSKNDQLLVLEDLSVKNFHVSSTSYMSEKQTYAVLQCLARFHGASLIFEEQTHCRINEKYLEEVTETCISHKQGHIRYEWLLNVTDCLKKLAHLFTKNADVPNKMEHYIMNDFKGFLLPSKKYRNCLTHDDLWKNNILFDRNDQSVLVDFQLTRYTPPVFDVLLFLYINQKHSYVEENFHKLTTYYYDSLGTVLKRHGLDVKKVIPKIDFNQSIEEYKWPALMEACMYGTNVLMPQELFQKITADPEAFEEFVLVDRYKYLLEYFKLDDDYRNRLSEVLMPMYRHFQ